MTATRRGKPRREHGLIVGHLMGEYSLARAFWLHTVTLGWGLSIGFGWLAARLADAYPLAYVSVAIIVYLPIWLLIWSWSTFGTFVSAVKHLFGDGTRLWGLVALAVICFVTLGVFSMLPGLQPRLAAYWAVAHGEQPGTPYTVRLIEDGRVAEFTGAVNEGAAKALEAVVGPAPKVTTVRLNSPGGWSREGERMAEVVKRYGLSTHVRDACVSACTFVFLAGLDRTVDDGAVLGFHRGRDVGDSARTQGPPQPEEMAVYVRAGVDPRFIQRVMATPLEAVWAPSPRELLKAGVTTR